MDQTLETLKIIIATVSGFIFAFFAEPVKIYFQNRNKIQNLRLALYKEIYHNYMLLRDYVQRAGHNEDFQAENLLLFLPKLCRTECYKQAMIQDPSFFYQLKEATMINTLYIDLAVIVEQPTLKDGSGINIIDWVASYLDTVNGEIEFGSFDKKLMSKIATKNVFDEMRKNGQALKKLVKKQLSEGKTIGDTPLKRGVG